MYWQQGNVYFSRFRILIEDLAAGLQRFAVKGEYNIYVCLNGNVLF